MAQYEGYSHYVLPIAARSGVLRASEGTHLSALIYHLKQLFKIPKTQRLFFNISTNALQSLNIVLCNFSRAVSSVYEFVEIKRKKSAAGSYYFFFFFFALSCSFTKMKFERPSEHGGRERRE